MSTCRRGTKRNMNKFFVCRCFFTHNYFIPRLNVHVVYRGESEFRQTYRQRLLQERRISDTVFNDIVKELDAECQRRLNLAKESDARRRAIAKTYRRLKPDVYLLQETIFDPKFLEIVAYCRSHDATSEGAIKLLHEEKASRVYSFPVFTRKFCEDFLAEVMNFEKSDLPKGRPNTMNKYGVLLDELGFDEGLLKPLREDYLSHITKLLYPDWGGDSLDSHKAFIVSYDIDRDRDLNYHYDNAEITINVALSTNFEEGSLYFGDMRDVPLEQTECTEYSHKKCFGLLHRGQHKHGALPIDSGERHNLIMWMRSSRIRNEMCPMCNEKPDLVETQGRGDGFTMQNVDICNML